MYILDTEQLLNKEGEIQMNNPFSLLRNKEIIAILDGDTKYGDYEFEDFSLKNINAISYQEQIYVLYPPCLAFLQHIHGMAGR